MRYIKLGEVIESAKCRRCGEDDYPVLSITKSDGIILQSEKFKKRIASQDTAQYKVVCRGQLVQGIHIDEANFGIQDIVEEGIVSPAYKIWNVHTDKISGQYLVEVLRSPRSIQYYSSNFNGSVKRRERLTDKDFLAMDIPCPSLVEQANVLEIIGKARNVIANRKLELERLENLIKARFVELMNSSELSEEVTVEEITERVKVGFVGTCEKFYTDESGIPMLRTGNITDKGIDLKDLKYVTEEFHEKNKKSQIHEGDLLIARHGSNGQANVYYGAEAQCLNAVVIVPNQSVARSIFLAGLINSPMVKEQIDRTLVGSTQHVVNTKSIASLKVRIPDLAVQNKYEDFVKQVDKSKFAVQKELEETQLLFDSFMQKYFG